MQGGDDDVKGEEGEIVLCPTGDDSSGDMQRATDEGRDPGEGCVTPPTVPGSCWSAAGRA